MIKTTATLRGGGCGSFRIIPHTQRNLKSDIEDLENFINRFDYYVDIICSKATVAADQSQSEEIMIAIQWFIFQEENIYKLNKNFQNVMKSYNLILEGIRKLLKCCLIYIKTDSFKCLYILQITASLSKAIFSFHILNRERFIKFDLQQEFLDISDELKQQMEIEKNDLIQIQMELYLFLTKTSFEMAPNNSNEREDILKGCLSGIITSIIQMKPNAELLESLFQGALLAYKMYTVSKNRQQYEVYFQIDTLQWEIISYFKNDKEKSLVEIIEKIQTIHEQLVKNSINWKFHFLWIQMIGKILIYNPLLTKQKLYQMTQFYLGANSRQTWKEYQNKGLLIQMNYSNDQAIILLNKLQNQKLLQLDRLILQNCFKEWENFILLKDFLLNEKNPNIHFTFQSYLQITSKLGNIEPQKDENILVGKIQTFFDFIISNKLLTLVKENYEKLGGVKKNFLTEMKNNIQLTDEKIQQKIYHKQVNQMILNFKEYLLSTQKIIRIIRLNSWKQPFQIKQFEQKQIVQFNNLQQLKYLIKILEQALQQLIQDFKDRMDDKKQNQSSNQNDEIDEWERLLQEKEFVEDELRKLELEEQKNSILDELKKKLLALPTTSLNQHKLLDAAQNLIRFITNSWKQLEKMEISLLQNNNRILFCENQLNNIFIYYEALNQQFKNNNNESMLIFKEIIQIKYEIETVSKTGNLKKIKLLLADGHLKQCIQNLRLKYFKLNLKLDIFKKSFDTILGQTNTQELQQLYQLINLDAFLLSVIKDYPKTIICCNNNFDKLTMTELANISLTQHDFEHNLQEAKGQIEYLQLRLLLEKQMMTQEELDLELIEKELGELFIDSKKHLEKIIEDLSIEELFKYVSDKQFNLSVFELKQAKEKFENFLIQVRKIKDSSKNQNLASFEYCEQLASQTEILIKTLGKFGKSDEQILQIIIEKELIIFKKIVTENKIHNECNAKQEIYLYQQNDQNKKMFERDYELFVQQLSKDFDFSCNKKSCNFLQWMIKLIKLQQQKMKDEIELLEKLLHLFTNFSVDLDQIHKFDQETSDKCKELFSRRFEQLKMKFEQIITTNINLKQEEDENFEFYIERVLSGLSQGTNDNEITQKQTNISDFIYFLKSYFEKKLAEQSYISNTPIEQEYLMKQIRQLYFQDSEVEEFDEKSNLQLDLTDTLIQKFKDFNSNEEWKIKQGLLFTIIQISSNCFTDTIISFCQKTLIQLWVSEKDQRVRNLLKNEKLVNIQMQILKKDWQTQQNRISGEMQQMFKRIDKLQEEISHEANLNKRDQQLKELDEITQQLDEYIGNVSEMGQQLRLITDFVNQIRKNLIRVEGKIHEIKEQLKSMGNDIKFLRGKSVEQLLEIRKWKVLKEASYKNVKSIYVPLKTQEKEENEQSNLMNLEQFDDKEAEVNEFLQQQKTVMLIHGVAGSGKSTTAKKIEEFIWKLHELNKKVNDQVLIPIYISLPILKNPVFQAVDETLRQDDYGFDDLQLKECKEKLESKEFRLLLIMDSYDEMKLENIQKNLYISNKIQQNWYNPLVIFTTRSEIFTSVNYMDWFALKKKTNLKKFSFQNSIRNKVKNIQKNLQYIVLKC